ncbi:hypothetical protein ACH0AH_04330 [Microbacterium paludicola]|uniref:hypothetical protein n=1 Tax=Microbacterium paludicola TaxID=300019 RepID=UPI00387985BA
MSMTNRIVRNKKKILAVLAGVAVAAAVSASASTLGGAGAETLGADAGTTISAVTKGVVVSWDTEFSTTTNEYVVTGVTLKTKDDATETFPEGADVKLTVLGNASGKAADAQSALDEMSELDLADATTTITWTGTTIPAQDVLGVAVVVDGNAVPATVN